MLPLSGVPPSPSNYLSHQVIQSRCLQVIGNYPTCTPTSHLHDTLNNEPIPVIIHQLKAKFFSHCTSNPNPLVQQITIYTLTNLTTIYKKYKHKGPKHILL